ncbi:PREDICTED: translation initiation factor IF-2-like [Chinchilla lanigera]|uniref:translation initiation factor IF-2-like n=1 Tax=Chinchilla lanigera TaxID=34839 RepID=UPI0006977ACB|nr:PREDICTED: translation initiation factor IF-2-like [Chinchilla lanigera]
MILPSHLKLRRPFQRYYIPAVFRTYKKHLKSGSKSPLDTCSSIGPDTMTFDPNSREHNIGEFVANLLKELHGVRDGAFYSEQVLRPQGQASVPPKPAGKLLLEGEPRAELGKNNVDDPFQPPLQARSLTPSLRPLLPSRSPSPRRWGNSRPRTRPQRRSGARPRPARRAPQTGNFPLLPRARGPRALRAPTRPGRGQCGRAVGGARLGGARLGADSRRPRLGGAPGGSGLRGVPRGAGEGTGGGGGRAAGEALQPGRGAPLRARSLGSAGWGPRRAPRASQVGPGALRLPDSGEEDGDRPPVLGCSVPGRQQVVECPGPGEEVAAARRPWTIISTTEDGKLMPSETENPFCY